MLNQENEIAIEIARQRKPWLDFVLITGWRLESLRTDRALIDTGESRLLLMFVKERDTLMHYMSNHKLEQAG